MLGSTRSAGECCNVYESACKCIKGRKELVYCDIQCTIYALTCTYMHSVHLHALCALIKVHGTPQRFYPILQKQRTHPITYRTILLRSTVLNLRICFCACWIGSSTKKILSNPQAINSNLISLIESLVERSIILKSIYISRCIVSEGLF